MRRCGHEDDRLNFPVGLALLDGKIFVADFGNHRVAAFDAVATGGPMDPQKSLVFRFELGRKGIAGAGASEFNLPRGLTTHDGQLIVADMMNHRLKVYTSDGQQVRTIGLKGTNPGHFKMPSDVASFGGKLFVAEYEGRRLQARVRLHSCDAPTSCLSTRNISDGRCSNQMVRRSRSLHRTSGAAHLGRRVCSSVVPNCRASMYRRTRCVCLTWWPTQYTCSPFGDTSNAKSQPTVGP